MHALTSMTLSISIATMAALVLLTSGRRHGDTLRALPARMLGKLWADLVWTHERWVDAVDQQRAAPGQALVFLAGPLFLVMMGALVLQVMRGMVGLF